MKIVRKPTFNPLGVVLMLGNFDGVHRGHQFLLQAGIHQARTMDVEAVVMNFYPPPRAYFLKGAYRFITPLPDKIRALAACGLHTVCLLHFNQRLANLSPVTFIEQYILPFNVKMIVVGDDFRFGKNREGNVDTLKSAGKRHGFKVHQIATQSDDAERISSSRIRTLLSAGKVIEAEALLGHSVSITGHVMHGDKRGRTLGFPTLNVAIRELCVFQGFSL